jgi:UTP--glucose-1-phosphate uridylyltransferase
MASSQEIRRRFEDMMRSAAVPDLAVRTFLLHLQRLTDGESGTLSRHRITPVLDIPDAEDVAAQNERGRAALDRTAVIKLNGGLGTSMGLDRAKSLLPVRDGLSFLDLIARQMLALREQTATSIPLLLMNSFRTADDSEAVLARYPDLHTPGLEAGFLQHKVPKVHAAELQPMQWAENPELEWCPPGHGDLYTALDTSGLLDLLLARGIEYAFVSNADNLGADLDLHLLGHMVEARCDFMMEVADRTAADRKGGHLCRLAGERLALRELAQCPADEVDEFQNIDRFRYFNTNNLWLRLPALRALLDEHDGVLPLATIINRKTVDPRVPDSPAVIQLETAMGSALALFEAAAAIRVPRHRFSPVKTTADLLAVRSDAYELTDDWRITLRAGHTIPPKIQLDDRYFKLVDAFDERFHYGVPSLADCDELEIEGDIWFGADVEIRGAVRISSPDPRAVVPSGTVVDADLEL